RRAPGDFSACSAHSALNVAFFLRLTMSIAILGGTGQQGPGLALRWAMAGEEVIIGSRSQERAEKMASELNAELGDARIRGMGNPEAAEAAEIVVLTVP